MAILPIILSGGVGSRLWPLSRKDHPKPFIELDDGESLLQKCYARSIDVSDYNEVVTVTNADLFHQSQCEFSKIASSTFKNTFLCEPVSRNTTASIALASHYAISAHGDESVILVVPADHLINDLQAFAQAIKDAEKLAHQSKLVTLGIKPSSPKTGYGYILSSGCHVKKFVEKPDRETAEKYIANGNYFWNSGIFCMKPSIFLEELNLLAPDIAKDTAKAMAGARKNYSENIRRHDIRHPDFEHIRSISVDYAVFEKSQNIDIVKCDIGWSDVGSWNDLGSLLPADKSKNNILGNAISKETNNCTIYGGERLIATYGIKDLIISDTDDALLIVSKDNDQDVTSIVDELKSRNDPIYKQSPTVHRPWGTYTVLQESVGFKVKRIQVKPGNKLSLQSHKYRSEHWIVVSGKAFVTKDEEQIELLPNQSIYIPKGHRHRLENRETEQLIVVEVQCGDYLGEDDIVRYDDIYQRT